MGRVRPPALAGFLTLAAMLAAANYGEPRHVIMVLVASFPVTFFLSTLRPRREHVSWAIAVVYLGVLWIGLPMVTRSGCATRCTATGSLIDVLVATFVGRHRRLLRRPLLRPDAAGAADLAEQDARGPRRPACWAPRSRSGSAGLYQDWLTGPHALLMGALVALAAPVGDLFESMIKRDLEVKDTGQAVRRPRRRPGPPGRGPLHGPGGLLRRFRPGLRRTSALDSGRVRRILIIGSTGSIGTQALDVVERNPELEVVGLAAASSWELLLEQAARARGRAVALADAGRGRAGERALGGRGAGRRRGPRRADHGLGLRPRPERAGRLGRPGPDGGGARRGHRPRAGQQGEPRRGRRAGHRARGGHRGRSCCPWTPSTPRCSS